MKMQINNSRMLKCNDEQLRFCIFIINQISQAKNKPSDVVNNLISESGILDDYIIGCYDTLHTLGSAEKQATH